MKVSFFRKNGVIHTVVSHVSKDTKLPAYAVFRQPLSPAKAIRKFLEIYKSLR